MDERLDLTELLKNCPEGMELDCAVFDNATFSRIDSDDGVYPIVIKTNSGLVIRFTRYGTYMLASEAKCLIFPKGKTTWEGFHKPFMDGDVVMYGEDQFAIFKEHISHKDGGDWIIHYLYFDEDMDCLNIGGKCFVQRLATEEEAERLFKALQAKGYQWDTETKTLKVLEVSESMVEPKFKVGDTITSIGNHIGPGGSQSVILGIDGDKYMFDNGNYIPINDQDNWKLVSDDLRSKFKNGDVLYVDCSSNGDCDLYKYTFILKEITDEHIRCYCYISNADIYKEFKTCNLASTKYTPRFATDQEKNKLFDAIELNGYNWNSETKTLEKLKPAELFKDGDIVTNISIGGTWIGIYHEDESNRTFSSYCYIRRDGVFCSNSDTGHTYCKTRLATEEEKKKLLDVINKNGYNWNPNTKTLEKLITPKFKVGDIIQSKDKLQAYTVSNVTSGYYSLNGYENKHAGIIPVEDQDNWILVKKEKFDPKTLKPFDMVLVTDATHGVWSAGFFSHMDQSTHNYPFMVNGARYRYCIPYNDTTAHLLGKSGKAPEYYRYWEDKV